MCGDVAADPDAGLDPGLACDDPNRDVVGRLVTLPAIYFAGGGTVDDSAAFLQTVILIQ
jgi:hypothetical protein